MKFECGDLDQALRYSELMPEAREHLKFCAACRREYHLWSEISSASRALHEDWETPELWPKIREQIEALRPPQRPWWKNRSLWAVAATVLLAAGLSPWWWARWQPALQPASKPAAVRADRDFLTEQALTEVERNEAAYRKSIEKLSQLAKAERKQPVSPYVVNEHEKLLAIDSAIAETRENVKRNRFNIHLQTTLAGLYREKQRTLEELLTRGKN